MAKTISTILNLNDKFSDKLNKAGENVIVFKIQLKNCGETAKSTDKALDKMGKTASDGKLDKAGQKAKNFEAQLKNCEEAAKKADKILGTMAKTALAAGTAAAAGLTTLAASSVNTYKDFQQSMANTGAIAGVEKTSAEFKALENAAREAGRTTSKTAKESADALGYMALAGWDTQQQISGLMPILQLSEATGADLATTSDLVTDSMSAFGIQVSELNKYLDIAANANNKTNQTATQLMETYIGAGGMLKNLGVGMEEAAAITGVLANRGIKGAEAGTSLNSILVNLLGNSKSSADALEKLGVSAYDSKGNFKGVTEVLKEISAGMKSATNETKDWIAAKLGGKTQMDTLYALLSGIETVNSEGVSELEELTAKFGESDGALEKMADAMRNTLSGSMAIAGSAMDDFKISIGEKLEPYISRFLNWFAEKLPGAAEKVSKWLDRNLPKAINFCKAAFENIKPVLKFVADHFSQIVSVAAAAVIALKGFSIISKIASFVNKLKTAETALQAAQLALNTSMLACPLTWIAVGLGGVVGAILLYNDAVEEAKQEDLEEHFGNISLSIEEMDRVVSQIVNSKNIEKLSKQMEKFRVLEPISKKIEESLEVIEKADWKLSVGLKLTVDEQDKYRESVDSYIADVKEYFESAFQADWNLFDGNTSVQTAIKRFYYGKSNELNELGKDLKEAINKGLADNVLTLPEEQEILNLANQMRKIKEGLAKSEYETQMGALEIEAEEKAKLNGGKLTAEDYNALMEKAEEEAEKQRAIAREGRAAKEYALKNVYKEGTPEYEEARREIVAKHYADLSEIDNSIGNFKLNTFHATYGEDLEGGIKTRDEVMRQTAETFNSADGPNLDNLYQAINTGFGMDASTLSNMSTLRADMDPEVKAVNENNKEIGKAIREYEKAGKAVPKYLLDSYNDNIAIMKEYQKLDRFTANNDDMLRLAMEETGMLIEHNPENDARVRAYDELTKSRDGDSHPGRNLLIGYEKAKTNEEKNKLKNAKNAKRLNHLMNLADEDGQGVTGPAKNSTQILSMETQDIPVKMGPFKLKDMPKKLEITPNRTSIDHGTAIIKKAKVVPEPIVENFNKKVDKSWRSPIEVIKKANTKIEPAYIDTIGFNKKLQDTIGKPIKTDVKADANVKAGNVNTSDFVNTVNSLFANWGFNLKIGVGGTGTANKSSSPKKGNATGTPYFGGGLTEINENGGEIINLPTGAQIIPSDKSAQMIRENAKNRMPNISMFNMPSVSFNNTPYFGKGLEITNRSALFDDFQNRDNSRQDIKKFGDIHINVNIDGNIVGTEDYADKIGDKVCERVVDLLNSI